MNIIKTTLLSFSTLLALSMALPAVGFDEESFGQSLNGWQKNRTASYSIDQHSYLTHRPTLTPTPGGGLFTSTRVDHVTKLGKKTTSYLELNFSADGTLTTAQIRIMAGQHQLTTGLITRPPLAAPADEANPEPWVTPTHAMINDLFKALDTEFVRFSKQEGEGKRDLFSRLFGAGYQTADLSAALRHNLNLLLRFTQ